MRVANQAEAEQGIESQLIDLTQMSLRQLRVCNDVPMNEAMGFVVEQLAQVLVWERSQAMSLD